MLYSLARPLLFRLDAEAAHRLTVRALTFLPAGRPPAEDPMLASTVAGLRFPNPVGLAAGFDKEGEVAHKMHRLGFGFAEIGTLTPLPQPGNPRPRLFRLLEDKAVVNAMGFNSGGQAAAMVRLKRHARGSVIGINIGANKDSTNRVADYATGVRNMAPLADYLTVNISSPNTPGLRALQDRSVLDELLATVTEARGGERPPIFLKVAPDLEPADIDDIAELTAKHRTDAIIVSNTTIQRPSSLKSPFARQAGGLSGAPLHDLALQRLRDFRKATGGAIPLIGVGGISNAEQAYARIRAGASLIQLYSALVFDGPFLPKRINAGLKSLLLRDGFSHISEAVGSETA
ncbi:MAG TPA: quinone-dependent dihydroorotate dehydrogenase [Rhizorhapis sp.]|nr:quinone-dependent dihydroorotate dehydrogenase [Rhizorhapis sp.]